MDRETRKGSSTNLWGLEDYVELLPTGHTLVPNSITPLGEGSDRNYLGVVPLTRSGGPTLYPDSLSNHGHISIQPPVPS